MARSTWGSKRRKGNGWELRFTVGGKPDSEMFYGTAKEADRRLADLRVKYEGVDGAGRLTVGQFWDNRYHDEIVATLSETTVYGYEQKYYHDIAPEFADDPMDGVRPRKVQDWLMTMPPTTARHARAVFSAMFSRAFALELVDDNPLQRRYLMPKGKTGNERDDATFTEGELRQIAEACEGEAFEAPFIMSGFGGASKSEAMGVQAPDVSRIGDYAVVTPKRSVHRVGAEIVVRDEDSTGSPLKNDFRERDIVIEPPHSFRLLDLASAAQAEADANGWDEAWLCGDGFGGVMCPNVMSQAFRRWFCDQPLVYHPFGNLRNSHSTMMLSRGIDGSMVAKMEGHATRGTTEKHYERPKAAEFIEAIEKVMGNSGK